MGKDKYSDLLKRAKRRFQAVVDRYHSRVKELEEENALLRYELKQVQNKRYKPKPPKKEKPPKLKSKKRGALFGHLGWFRQKPKKVDRIEMVKLKRCPICGGGDLTECKEKEEHIQEDIILPQVKVTKYIRHHYYCKGCKKVVSGKGKEEIPNSYIGPGAKALASFLRYGIKISTRDVQRIFRDLFNLKIVPSSIPGFNNQLRVRALPIYQGIQDKIKRARSCNADETGWRLDGKNHWLWSFSNHKASLFHIDKSRGQKVVKKILGDKYNGVLISDFLSAYNKIQAKAKQRCIIHLERDLEKVEACSEDKFVKRYCQYLLKLLEQAKQLHKDYKSKKISREYFERRRDSLVNRLKDFNLPLPDKRHLKRFSQRLIRHKDELFTFLYYPNISYHNNQAERHIRPNVIFRKITFGNRSTQGTLNHSVLMSILQTAKLNKLDPLLTLKKIFTLPEKHRTVRLLIPP